MFQLKEQIKVRVIWNESMVSVTGYANVFLISIYSAFSRATD